MTTTDALDRFGRDDLVTLVREYLLAGHLIDRSGMPHLIAAAGPAPMTAIAIEEWMGASPVYTRRMQRLLGIDGRDDVETIFKGMQLDVGAPPQFMDFRYRVDGPDRGEFWLDSCGALADVEPMGEELVVAMCHHIEDPTFPATACATNPRAVMRPIHRPPREPADRHPHCHWTVVIDPDTPPAREPEAAVRVATTRAARVAPPQTPELRSAAAGDADSDGRTDYRGPLEADLDLASFSDATLRAIAEEVALQGHLLVLSFVDAVRRRFGDDAALDVGRRQFVGIAGLAAERLASAIGAGPDLDGVEAVLRVHPAFRPVAYVALDVEHLRGRPGADADRLVVRLGDCDALHEETGRAWPAVLEADDAPLDSIVRAVAPTAACTRRPAEPGCVASWEVRLGGDPRPESDEVMLTRFSTGANFVFTDR